MVLFGIDIHVLIVISVVLALIIFLFLGKVPPALLFVGAIVLLMISGVISPSDALSGFSNEQLAIIILLLIISNVLNKTSFINSFFIKNFEKSKSKKIFLAKLSFFISIFSAFLNNTPIVAMAMPYVYNWCKKYNVAPSKVFIPLSYAAILGGCVTLIGTSTNLIVNSLAVEANLPSLNIFDFTIVGLPLLIIGIIYIVFFSDKILPDYTDIMGKWKYNHRKYLVETKVKKNSTLIGKKVKDANLRNLKGLFLVEIVKKVYDNGFLVKEKTITPVSPNDIIEENDILIFAGDTSSITELTTNNNDIELPESNILNQENIEVIELIISYNSSFIGKTLKETDFRGRYDAAVIGIHRNGEKLSGKIGGIHLQAGDVLLILAGKDFFKRIDNTQDFYVLSKLSKIHQPPNYKTITIFFLFIIAVILSSLKLVPLFISLSLILIFILSFKLSKTFEIKQIIDYNLIIIIAMGLALGKAISNSGTAEIGANFILNNIISYGIFPLLLTIFIITNFLSAIITSKAAVAIIFPVVFSIIKHLQIDPAPFVIIVALGGAANFITPIGYQTNLMVYGPGGYKFRDFFKIGFPLTLIYMFLSSIILMYWYNLW